MLRLHLAFENATNAEEILKLKNQIQVEFDEQIGNCDINIIVGE